eukprot:3339883-Pyramimonas_sp.AAC.1
MTQPVHMPIICQLRGWRVRPRPRNEAAIPITCYITMICAMTFLHAPYTCHKYRSGSGLGPTAGVSAQPSSLLWSKPLR